ncbi:MAG: UDP-N-acetylmuramate--L-alanine ligase [Gammaproteobacteria bacterium]|jgi:UDP-N-acetylmuramate--alanine ligase
MRRIKHIHFVGIGGSGMGGIAEVLLHEGYKISGSDLSQNAVTKRLLDLGVDVYIGHDADFIKGADVLVISSAIKEDNPEVVVARKQHIPVVPRAEMLAELMRFRYGVAIAGTHGKTTTTSLATSILAEAGLDPTFVIGGRLNSAGTNAHLGSGKYLVAEADESDASFLLLQPTIAIVTNIDADHMATYHGNFATLKQAFIDFLHKLPFYGLAILCVDDPNVREIMPKISRPAITYGFSKDADVQAINFSQRGTQCYFTVKRKGKQKNLDVVLNSPGEHNVLNALAAIAIATELGVDNAMIMRALQQFAGVGRRFQQLGAYKFNQGKALFIDDYGHHPKEVEATIKAARQSWPDNRLVMIFQPHRYTRTRDLFDEFSYVLDKVDCLLMLPIYAASELPIEGISAKNLCANIRKIGKLNPIFIESTKNLSQQLNKILLDGDIVIAQGAGSISSIARELIEESK